MKKFFALFLLLAFLSSAVLTQSCSRKSGCPAIEGTKVKTNRHGDLSTKGGNSQLFPKKMRRKN